MIAGLTDGTLQPSSATSRRDLGLPNSSTAMAGSVRQSRAADATQAGLLSPPAPRDAPLSKGGSQGMAAPKEPGSPSDLGSPTYKALAQHAASIETFLAAGDASTSAQEESTALAQLMQVLNDNAAPGDP